MTIPWTEAQGPGDLLGPSPSSSQGHSKGSPIVHLPQQLGEHRRDPGWAQMDDHTACVHPTCATCMHTPNTYTYYILIQTDTLQIHMCTHMYTPSIHPFMYTCTRLPDRTYNHPHVNTYSAHCAHVGMHTDPHVCPICRPAHLCTDIATRAHPQIRTFYAYLTHMCMLTADTPPA